MKLELNKSDTVTLHIVRVLNGKYKLKAMSACVATEKAFSRNKDIKYF